MASSRPTFHLPLIPIYGGFLTFHQTWRRCYLARGASAAAAVAVVIRRSSTGSSARARATGGAVPGETNGAPFAVDDEFG